jgi:hypothetical protein
MGDHQHLSHILVCYIEKEEIEKVSNETMVHRFITLKGKGSKCDL